MTFDEEGKQDITTLNINQTFYLHLYGNTNNHNLITFQYRFQENNDVCTMVRNSDGSSMDAEYIGNDLSAKFGDYEIEVLQRAKLGKQYFTSYSRSRGPPIKGDFVHLGWIRFKMVNTGNCIVKSMLCVFTDSSSDIPGVRQNVPIFNNQLDLRYS